MRKSENRTFGILLERWRLLVCLVVLSKEKHFSVAFTNKYPCASYSNGKPFVEQFLMFPSKVSETITCSYCSNLNRGGCLGQKKGQRLVTTRLATQTVGADWQVGNVYDDLDNLERAIAIADADIYKEQLDTKEELDAFAEQRRPLVKDLFRFVVLPLALASILTFLTNSKTCKGARLLAPLMIRLFDIEFWSNVVALPVIMLRSKQKSLPPPDPLPEKLQKWADLDMLHMFSATELSSEYDWDDPKSSCKDHVLCLLEQWKSSVLGIAMMGVLLSFLPPTSSAFWLAVAISQFFNRLGAIASLHQYPSLLFQLQRRKQPRPMDRFQVNLSSRVNMMLSMAPFGIAASLAKIMVIVGNPIKTRSAIVQISSRRPIMKLAYMALFASFLGPIIHMLAIKRIFSGAYQHHDLSHALPDEDIQAILDNPKEHKRRFKWRYSLDWRDPERVSQTISKVGSTFVDWLFYEGSVDQKLMQISHGETKTVLDWIAEDEERGHNYLRPHAVERKVRAMERLSTKHEKDYASGTFSDPLGVAVWKVFGLGLNYDFDHSTDLDAGEEPSIFRLRARAAKSAIRRYTDIYDGQAAAAELSLLTDIEERNQKAAEMRQEAEIEVKYLADSLARLLPFNPGTDPRIKYDVQIMDQLPQSMRKGLKQSKFKKIRENEYIRHGDSDHDPAVEALLKRYGKKKENPPTKPDSAEDSGADDDFVDEWLKRKHSVQDEGNQDDENDLKTVLISMDAESQYNFRKYLVLHAPVVFAP